MPLHNLRTVNFLTASSDTVLFLEVLLVSFLIKLVKNHGRTPLVVVYKTKLKECMSRNMMIDY